MYRSRILLLGFLLSIHLVSQSQTTLSSGDLAIIQYNSDNPDNLAFVCLRAVDSGTEVKFTDRGWDTSGTFRSGEGTMIWTADSDLMCGSIVYLDSVPGLVLSASGDQVLVYQGADSSPVFITAVNAEGAAVWQDNAVSSSTSALPPGLSNGSSALAVFEKDNLKYTGLSSGTLSQIRAQLFDSSKYTGNDSNHETYSAVFNISGACVLPVRFLELKITQSFQDMYLEWSTAMEIDNSHFLVQMSEDGHAFSTVAKVLSQGNSYSIQNYRFLLGSDLTNAYFRIKQVDFNGTSSVSRIIYHDSKEGFDPFSRKGEKLIINLASDGRILVYDQWGRLCFDERFVGVYEFIPSRQGNYLVMVQDVHKTGVFFRYFYVDLLTSK
jgi:hypothetical protein